MDLITTFLAMRMAENALAKNGQIGYVEQRKVIAWDGDTTGLEVEYIASGRLGYKISNDVVDLTKVTKITDINGELTPDRYSFEQYDNVQQISDEFGYAIIRAYMDVPNPDGNIEKGVFFGVDIRSIELSGTIVPIDPKYLPGPKVLDLDEYGLGEVISSLIATGGGNRNGYFDGDSTIAKTIIKTNPDYVFLSYGGMPVACTVATKVVYDTDIYFGFKAFLLMSGEIAEVTVAVEVRAVDYIDDEGNSITSYSDYDVTVQM